MNKNCIHFIGFLSDQQITTNNINNVINTTVEFQKQLTDWYQINNKQLTPKQLLNKNYGYIKKFNFCPYCGTKINWKLITKYL